MCLLQTSRLILWVYQRHLDFTKRTPRVMCLQHQIADRVLLHACTCRPDLKTNITANLSKSYTSKPDTPPSRSECVYRQHLTSTQYTRGRELEDDIRCVRLTLPQHPAAQRLILELHVNTHGSTSIRTLEVMKLWRNVVPCQNYSWVWWTFPPGQSHLWTRVLERRNAGRTCSWARGRYSSLRACVSFPSFCERAASVCERWPNAGPDSVKDSICGRKTNRRFFSGRQEIKIFNFVWESRINLLRKTLSKQFESHTVCHFTVPSYHLESILWNWFTLCLMEQIMCLNTAVK